MKKLMIDFGVEDIVVSKVEIKPKVIKVLDTFTINSANYIQDSGKYDITRLSYILNSKLGQDLHKLDIDIVLPEYMTASQYYETSKIEDSKANDFKDSYNPKLTDFKKVFIGDNGLESISQVILYNKEELKRFIRSLFKENINAMNAISAYSAYQNTMPFFSSAEGEEEAKARIFIMVGISRIAIIAMVGNLPIYIDNEVGMSLIDSFKILQEQIPELHLSNFLNMYKACYEKDRDTIEMECQEYELKNKPKQNKDSSEPISEPSESISFSPKKEESISLDFGIKKEEPTISLDLGTPKEEEPVISLNNKPEEEDLIILNPNHDMEMKEPEPDPVETYEPEEKPEQNIPEENKETPQDEKEVEVPKTNEDLYEKENTEKSDEDTNLEKDETEEKKVSHKKNKKKFLFGHGKKDKNKDDKFSDSVKEMPEATIINPDAKSAINPKTLSLVSNEIDTISGIISEALRDIIGYVEGKYGNQNVEVCTNSRTMAKYMESKISGLATIHIENKANSKIDVNKVSVELADNVDTDIYKNLGCLGSIVCNMKKGADFYV